MSFISCMLSVRSQPVCAALSAHPPHHLLNIFLQVYFIFSIFYFIFFLVFLFLFLFLVYFYYCVPLCLLIHHIICWIYLSWFVSARSSIEGKRKKRRHLFIQNAFQTNGSSALDELLLATAIFIYKGKNIKAIISFW